MVFNLVDVCLVLESKSNTKGEKWAILDKNYPKAFSGMKPLDIWWDYPDETTFKLSDLY